VTRCVLDLRARGSAAFRLLRSLARQELGQFPRTLPRQLGIYAPESDHDPAQAFLELGAGHAAQRTAGDGW